MCRGLVSYVLIDIVFPCCLQNVCVQVIRNLNRHSLSPKSKSGHKNYFCCCIKLTHIRKVVFNTFLKGIYCKYTWTRIFSLSFVFGNHVSHALADIVTSNQNQNQSYNSAISNSFALIIWSYMKAQQFNENSQGVSYDGGSKQDYVLSWFRFPFPFHCCSWVTILNDGTKQDWVNWQNQSIAGAAEENTPNRPVLLLGL